FNFSPRRQPTVPSRQFVASSVAQKIEGPGQARQARSHANAAGSVGSSQCRSICRFVVRIDLLHCPNAQKWLSRNDVPAARKKFTKTIASNSGVEVALREGKVRSDVWNRLMKSAVK